MKLYRWRSEALKNYATGDILAIGADVEDARRRAREQFNKVGAENWEWLFAYTTDLEELAEREAKLAALEADIMAEPEVAEAFFIAGGE